MGIHEGRSTERTEQGYLVGPRSNLESSAQTGHLPMKTCSFIRPIARDLCTSLNLPLSGPIRLVKGVDGFMNEPETIGGADYLLELLSNLGIIATG